MQSYVIDDFLVEDHGTVVRFIPQTDTAKEAVLQMDLEDYQLWGAGFVVDHRAAEHLIEALADEGISVTTIPA